MIARLGSAVVLGAGTMGSQLAALLAGAGATVRLLDLEPETAVRGLDRARALRPSPLYRPADAERIRPGGFDELEAAVVGADWVLEAVVEQLEPKRALFERLDAVIGPMERPPLLSTNTSGLSIAALADGRSAAFRRVFLGTHFFNPPRYARLLELIPLAETDPARVAWIEELASRALGKATVRAKDTPAFIANRLGVHGLLTALDLARELGLGVDEVDDLTGPLIGRPKSAVFRTLDLVGIDVAVAVADHCLADLPDDPERDRFAVPEVLRTLVADGRLGEKSGAGFYRRDGSEILALDLDTGEYRPRRKVRSAAIDALRNEPELGRRLGALFDAADRAPQDAPACFLRRLFSSGLGYAATVGPEIADDAGSIDRAIRFGFGWQIGPFETWDVIGHHRVASSLPSVPPLLEQLGDRPERSFHRDAHWLEFRTLELVAEPARARSVDLDARRRASNDLPANASGTAVDLGEGILGLELHGRHDAIGVDTLDLVIRAVDAAERRFDGLVVGTRRDDFSLGANLALLLVEAEDAEWDELHRAVRRFQAATGAIRYAGVPVVVAPRGRTLGGGAELALAGARQQPLAETYIGLVETGVGLIPAGGGSTAMARRAAERVPAGLEADRFPFFRQALETIALAKVATSAEEARDLGLVGAADLVTADRDRQWADAAATARHLAEVGYRPPLPRAIPVVGRRGVAAAEALTWNQLQAGQMSEHDRRIVLALANVMSGGDVAEGTELGEDYLLDLEREAFVSLLGERLTRDRIRHTLKTGKPLRN